MKPQRYILVPLIALLVGGAFFTGLFIGEGKVPSIERVSGLLHKEGDVLSIAASSTDAYDFSPYWRVWNTLERKFIPFSTSTEASVPPSDRMYSSIEGLVSSYKDPYTEFMRPQRSEEFKIVTRGSLEGIGAVVGEREGAIVIVGPLPNSPAERSGLLAGDKVLSIDTIGTEGMTLDEAVSNIRGEGGTTVTLHIAREGQESFDVSVVRGTIEIPSTAHAVVEREVPKIVVQDETLPTSVTGESPDVPGTPGGQEADKPVETEKKDFYVLRLFSFSQTSVAAFERELEAYAESGSDALIVDLRGNPGGYLDAAVYIAGWFLPKNTVVVREYQGPDHREVVHATTNGPKFPTTPELALLVDSGSASASEILAGALQEHGVATVVGTRTFGKGSVQELIDITEELSLKVTVARWYTPEGVSISNGGLVPDVLVDPSTATSSDPWIDAAVEALTSPV
jgi:carboxyl-terminal processing protease